LIDRAGDEETLPARDLQIQTRSENLKTEQTPPAREPALEPDLVSPEQPSLGDPRAVLALLETDQVVAEKRRTRFGRREFSLGLKVLLWSLRVYVILMLVIVVIAVLQAIHALD
jgi:hypothetical protein